MGDFKRPIRVPSAIGGWGLTGLGLPDVQDMLAACARMVRGYETQVRVKDRFARSEYREACERFSRVYTRTAVGSTFELGKYQMSVLWAPSAWCQPPQNGAYDRPTVQNALNWTSFHQKRQKMRECVEGWHNGVKHDKLPDGSCSGCIQVMIDRQVRRLGPFWTQMRNAGQAMALSGELDVLTDGDIDDKKVENLYLSLLTSCHMQEVPAYQVFGQAWGVDEYGHTFSEQSFPNWGAHEAPSVTDVWHLPSHSDFIKSLSE
jgi:hypothetical protein